jgi:ABC-type branched-subunit amino acid transport system substrate-binding protein
VESRRSWLPARRARVVSLAALVAAAITITACSSSGSPSGSSSASSGASSARAATKSPIEVGLVTSLTSSSLAPYPQDAVAQEAAIAYINSPGGINGHPLQAKQRDD